MEDYKVSRSSLAKEAVDKRSMLLKVLGFSPFLAGSSAAKPPQKGYQTSTAGRHQRQKVMFSCKSQGNTINLLRPTTFTAWGRTGTFLPFN